MLAPAAEAPAGSRLSHVHALGCGETLRDLDELDAYSIRRTNWTSGWISKLVWTLVLHMGKCYMVVLPQPSSNEHTPNLPQKTLFS